MCNVLVLGGDHHNTLGVIESLALKGMKSDVIVYESGITFSYVLKSRYVHHGWVFDDLSRVLECMLEHYTRSDAKTVVIATNDELANFLDQNYSALSDFFYLPILSCPGKLGEMMSKQAMSELAEKVGLNVPKTLVVNDNTISLSAIEYPCITKAISSVAGSKENIRICRSEEDLEEFLQNSTHCPVIQVQKYIDKDFEFQLLGCSLNSGNEIIIPGRTHVDRPNGIDNTFFLKFLPLELEYEDLVNKVKSFIKLTGYSGLFSVEFLKGKDGNNYFMEMNFRNDGNAFCVTDAGVNLPFIWYAYNKGIDYSSEIHPLLHDSYIMPELYYTKRMFAGEVSLKEWLNNLRKTTCYTTYFKQDKVPFFYFLLVSIKHLNNAILRKLKLK